MTAFSRDAITNVIQNGVKRDIDILLANKAYRGALVLIYAGIDFLARLSMPPQKTKVTRDHFIAWAERYIQFPCRDQLTGLDLYAARCGVLHTYSADSDLTVAKKARRIGYGDNMKPEVRHERLDNADFTLVSIHGLRDAFYKGIDACLVDIFASPARAAAAEARLQETFHELPFDDLGR